MAAEAHRSGVKWLMFLVFVTAALAVTYSQETDDRPECSVIRGVSRDLFPLAGDRGELGVRGLRKPGADVDGVEELGSAEDFTVDYFRTFKVLRNLRMGETYVLYQCGTDAPIGQELEEALQKAGHEADAPYKLFSIPLRSVAVTDTVSLAMLEDLGLQPRVEFLPSWSASPCSQMLLGCQEGPFNASDPTDVEAVDGIVKSDTPAWPGNHPPDVDPKVIQFSASQDPGALARAEWLKFISVFFNKDLEAEALFQLISGSFQAHKEQAANAGGPQPAVAWCTYNAISTWNTVESVECFTGGAFKYKKDLVEAAGATLLGSAEDPEGGEFKFEFGSLSGVADLLSFLRNASIVVDETYASDNDGYTLDSFKQNYKIADADPASYQFLQNEAVLRVDKAIGETTDGLDWFEKAISRPDIVVKDLFHFTQPALAEDGRQTHFVRNIAKGELTQKLLMDDCGIAACEDVHSRRTHPLCPLDAKLCSDGDSYVAAQFRNASAGCHFTVDCDFPGLKDRQPLECADVSKHAGGDGKDDFFPLIFDGESIKRDGIEDGSETDLKAVIDEAEDFAVVYLGSFKVVVNKRMKEIYILYQCGLFPPLVEDLLQQLQDKLLFDLKGYKAPKFFSIPLQNIAVDATVPIAMMEDLGLHPRISYVPSYVASSCTQKLYQCQTAPLNYTHLESNPNELDGIFRSDTPAWPGPYPASLERKMIQFSATQDPGALQRAEWYKFLGLFFNQDLEADKLYDEVAASYKHHSGKALAKSGSNKAVVAWCTYNAPSNWNSMANVVCHTGGIFQYKLELVEAAGGELLDSVQSDGSSVEFILNSEEAITSLREHLAKADIIIDETYSYSNDEYTIANFKQGYQLEGLDEADFPFLSGKSVWRLDKAIGATTGGLDWFQTAVARPDLVLLDLISFVTPEASDSSHETHFMRNIALGELTKPISPDACPEKSCSGFIDDITDKPICTLDIGVCSDGSFQFRNPDKNCSFAPCPVPVKALDSEIVLIVATFTMDTLTVEDWTDLRSSQFKKQLSDAFRLPGTDRIHVVCVEGPSGLVVQANVAFAKEDTENIQDFTDSLTSKAGTIFDEASFGAVSAVVGEASTVTDAEYKEMKEADGQCSAGSALVALPVLAVMTAVVSALLLAA
mmetsp:Transcript_5462/g.15217  ORF Transcript_5462/g.15217 Transcript_5462/m.15217 type:complete len:1142 (+) Transcript_5462:194-3619(+)